MKIRLGLVIALVVSVVECTAAPVLLKMKWEPGDKQITEVEITQEQSTKMDMLPQPMTQLTKQTIRTATTVMPKPSDGGSVIEMEFMSVSMKTEVNGVTMNFDSADDDPSADQGNPMAPIMRGMLKSKFTYYMDPKGELKKITGIDEFIENISNGNAMMKTTMEQMINEDMMKDMSGGALDADFLPEKAVDIGAKWEDKKISSIGPLGKTAVKNNYTFKGWEKKKDARCALITFTGTIKTAQDEEAAEGLMGVTIDSLNGSVLGKIWFDPKEGVVLVSEIQQDIEMNMSMSPEGSDMNQKIESSISQKIVSTLIEKK